MASTMMDLMEKENHILPISRKEELRGSSDILTPSRTPLQDVNGTMVRTPSAAIMKSTRLLKQAQYSNITPYSTPQRQTPRRKSAAVKTTILKYADSNVSGGRDVLLNSLIFKKLNDILDEKQQEYESQLNEKLEEIKSLKNQLADKENREEEDGDQINAAVSGFVQGVINKAMQQHLHASDINLLNMKGKSAPECENGEAVVNNVKHCTATSPLAQKTKGPEVMSSGTSPLVTTMVTPTKTVDGVTSMTPLILKDLCEAETVMTPVKLYTCETSMTPLKTVNIGVGSPIHMANSETVMTPVRMENISTTMSPIQMQNVETCVTPVRTIDAGQSMSPVVMATNATAMTPPPVQVDRGTVTSPFCHAVGRPSDVYFSRMTQDELSVQLETAAISNTLLRDELRTIQKEKESLYGRLAQTQQEVREKQGEITNVQHLVQNAQQTVKSDMQQQIDDMMLQQATLLDQQAILQSQLMEKDNALSTLKDKYSHQMAALKEENSNLQQDLCRAYRQKKNEVAALHAEYASKDYKPYFDNAQKTIREMETQLNEYVELMEQVETAQELQTEIQQVIQDNNTHYTAMYKEHNDSWAQWQKQHIEWEEQISENNRLVSEAVKVKDEACLERDEIEKTSQKLQQELTELRKNHVDTCQSLNQATSMVTELTSQVEQLNHDLTSCEERFQQANSELATSQGKQQDLSAELHAAKDLLQQTSEEKENLQKLVQDLEQLLSASQAVLQEHQEKFETEQANLVETLQSKTSQVEKLTSEQEHLKGLAMRQVKAMKMLEMQASQNKQLQQEIAEMHQQMEKMQQSAQESQQFLDEERSIIAETLADTEGELAASQQKCDQLSAEVTKKTQEVEATGATNAQLKDQLSSLEDQLEHTKAHAHFLLLKQGNEISDTIISVSQFAERLAMLQQELGTKVLQWTSKSEVDEQETSQSPECAPSGTPKSSFLNSIFKAVRGSHLEQESVTDNKEDSAEENQVPTIGSSDKSAFVRVRPSKISQDRSEEQSPTKSESNDIPLNEQIDGLADKLGKIICNINQLDKAVNVSHKELEQQLNLTQKELKDTTQQASQNAVLQAEQLRSVEKMFHQSQLAEARLCEELKDARLRITNMDKQMATSRDRVDDMIQRSAKMNANHANRRLQSEVDRLSDLVQQKEDEVSILQGTLNSTLTKLSDNGGSEASHIREIVSLQRQIKQLQKKNYNLKEENENVAEKAKKRIMVYRDNWQKAEGEVTKLDELFEQVRQTLGRHSGDVKDWTELSMLRKNGLLEPSEKNIESKGISPIQELPS